MATTNNVEKSHLDTRSIDDVKVTIDQTVVEDIDPDEERKLVRKLDMVILPLMALVYFFQCNACPVYTCTPRKDKRR